MNKLSNEYIIWFVMVDVLEWFNFAVITSNQSTISKISGSFTDYGDISSSCLHDGSSIYHNDL